MTTQTKKKRRIDLSHIDNLADLMQEKKLVKARLKSHQQALNDQWRKLPAESLKFAVRKVVPFYLNNKVLDKSWGIVGGLMGLVNKNTRGEAKKDMLGNAKKLGLFAAVRTAYNLWKKKK